MPVYVSADTFEFEMAALPEEQECEYIYNLSISPIETQLADSPIVCFDVNVLGMYALGHSSALKKTVCVYNSSNDFLYGFGLFCSVNCFLEPTSKRSG